MLTSFHNTTTCILLPLAPFLTLLLDLSLHFHVGLSSWRASVPVKHMSGGQRMRLAMAIVMFNRPDCLILDEPTNHLDSETVDSLAAAISDFQGAVIVVSHDEEFLNCLLNTNGGSKKDKEDNDGGKGGASQKGDGKARGTGLTLEAKVSKGEILYFQGTSLKRFDGSFSEYKKNILKKMMAAPDNFNF
jgi:ATPase subunit of ABC transporter with duplicated ATPase domains